MDHKNSSLSFFAKWISVLYRYSQIFVNRNLGEYHISGSQIGIIYYLLRNTGVSQDEIVKNFLLDKATIGRHLKSLEKNGLVNRKISPDDHRFHQVELTEKAKELIPLFQKTGMEWNGILTNGMTTEEIEILKRLLLKVVDNVLIEFDMKDKCRELS